MIAKTYRISRAANIADAGAVDAEAAYRERTPDECYALLSRASHAYGRASAEALVHGRDRQGDAYQRQSDRLRRAARQVLRTGRAYADILRRG